MDENKRSWIVEHIAEFWLAVNLTALFVGLLVIKLVFG